MQQELKTLTPKELKNLKIISIIFIIISLFIIDLLSKTIGTILLIIGIIFVIISSILGSKDFTKDMMINVLKVAEPGYNDWNDNEIKKQIEAIEECGYKWFEKNGKVGFRHSKTKIFLLIEGLNFYKPEDIKKNYKEVWSKDDPDQIRKRTVTAEKLAEAISNNSSDEEIESILEEHRKK